MNLEALTELYQLTQTEIDILTHLDHYCCENPETTLNIRTAATDCYTSPTTIIRLAKKLHFSGYNELIYQIKESHLKAPHEQELSDETTRSFCQLLTENQSGLTVLLGTGFSSHLSSYMSEVLNFHYIPSITTSHTALINSRNNQKIILIIVSHSGEEADLKKTVELAKQKNDVVISFLGSARSSIAKLSDLVISTDSYSPFSTAFAQPQIFFGQTLILFESLICAYINSKGRIE